MSPDPIVRIPLFLEKGERSVDLLGELGSRAYDAIAADALGGTDGDAA